MRFDCVGARRTGSNAASRSGVEEMSSRHSSTPAHAKPARAGDPGCAQNETVGKLDARRWNRLTDRAGKARIGRPWNWSGKGLGVGRGKPRFLGSARRYLGLWRPRFGLFRLRRLRILLVQLVPRSASLVLPVLGGSIGPFPWRYHSSNANFARPGRRRKAPGRFLSRSDNRNLHTDNAPRA